MKLRCPLEIDHKLSNTDTVELKSVQTRRNLHEIFSTVDQSLSMDIPRFPIQQRIIN